MDSPESYALLAEQTTFEPGEAAPFRFRVLAPDGRAVNAYRVLHERELHLIVVRRDLATFSHLHPLRDPDGTWQTDLMLPSAGPYRAFADVAPVGAHDMTLAVDLSAPGEWTPQDLPPVSATAHVDDYEVRMSGALVAGAHSTIAFEVTRGGEPVELQPYLGALGHLVALRAEELEYLHVHPLADASSDSVRFGVEVPRPGAYRLFFQFRHAEVVHTVALTSQASGETVHPEPPSAEGHHGPGH